jgi:FkbM family methyltransferase
MMRTLTAGTTFVDVGGAIGYHTVIGAALTGKTGHVISFEPQAAQRRFIEDNIRLNGLTNVTLLPYGLLDRRATLPLHISELSPAGATLGAISDPREDRIETVECVPFDDLVDAGDIELSRLDLVKIDTEGADALVLDGMSRAVRVFRPTIVVELLAPLLELFGLRPKDLWDRFADLGYEALALPWEFQKPALADLPHRVLWGDIPAIPFETCAQLDEALAILGEHYPNFGIDLLALPKAESSSH